MNRNKLINNPEVWIQFTDSRNKTSHSYDENTAKGLHHPFSDVDILIEDCNTINRSVISDAIEKMEESTFPYKVDVVFLSELAESYHDDVHNSKVEI